MSVIKYLSALCVCECQCIVHGNNDENSKIEMEEKAQFECVCVCVLLESRHLPSVTFTHSVVSAQQLFLKYIFELHQRRSISMHSQLTFESKQE